MINLYRSATWIRRLLFINIIIKFYYVSSLNQYYFANVSLLCYKETRQHQHTLIKFPYRWRLSDDTGECLLWRSTCKLLLVTSNFTQFYTFHSDTNTCVHRWICTLKTALSEVILPQNQPTTWSLFDNIRHSYIGLQFQQPLVNLA